MEKRDSGAARTPDDLHLLTAVPWDLQLPQTRDLELGTALPAHQVDIEIINVLGLRGGGLVGGREGEGLGEAAVLGEDIVRDRSIAMPTRQITNAPSSAVSTTIHMGTEPTIATQSVGTATPGTCSAR